MIYSFINIMINCTDLKVDNPRNYLLLRKTFLKKIAILP